MTTLILGGGQLARMLAQSPTGQKQNIIFLVEPEVATTPVQGLGEILVRDHSLDILSQVKKIPDIKAITVETENIPAEGLVELAKHFTVRPNPNAVIACQNRQNERALLDKLAIPTSPHGVASNTAELTDLIDELGLPLVVKTLTDGYDGKGQWVIQSQQAFAELTSQQAIQFPVLAEQKISFNREVSLIGARTTSGEMSFYPLAENIHQRGILVASMAPAASTHQWVETAAQDYLRKIMEELDYIGVMAMECFETDEQLLVNELAPRVHNSGHWSLNSNVVSQFDNHMRAINDLPLGKMDTDHSTLMLNILGEIPEKVMQSKSGFEVYDYQKSARPGRKVGHASLQYQSREQLISALQQLSSEWDNSIIQQLVKRFTDES